MCSRELRATLFCVEKHLLWRREEDKMKQNITLSLEKDLIRKAKILAAERGTSISRLLSDFLAGMVNEEGAYEAARRRALTLLERGFHLGEELPCPREAWHER